jgi:two-component system, cell cycle sensor histidine kinase and response regulator CckA
MSSRSLDPSLANAGMALRYVTEERVGEIAGNRGEGYFQTLFDSALDAFIVIDSDSCFLDANPAACQLIGLDKNELIGRNVRETIETGMDFDAAWSKFTKDGTYRGQRWMVRSDGSRRLIEIRATANVLPGRHFAVWRDVTSRYFLESELVQRERDHAVVRLAGAIAHDFTNLLLVIAGHAELMAQQLSTDSEPRSHIERILSSTKQASSLTTQLSALSRQQVLNPVVVDLIAFIRDCRGILRRLVSENVELELPQNTPPAQIRIDHAQIAQIIFTLASDAGGFLVNGGRLTIKVSAVKLDQALATMGVRIPSGDYIVLEFEACKVNFDKDGENRSVPVLSTAQRLGSIGTALPAVSATLKQNNAFLRVSESAQGRTMGVYFPRTANGTGVLEQPPNENLKGSETILLVEDDPMLREATREYLKCLGYRVLHAGDGEEALRVAQPAGHINALVADLRMPKMGGRELAEKLTFTMPGIKVMFVSGNIDGELIRRKAEAGGPALLPKPFVMRQLARMLRDLLDGKTTATS